jgi:hypothetical protein
MTRLRKVHSYIGLFLSPSVLFFSLTGATQLFDLHEAHGNYHPAAIVEKLSSVHKDQVFAFGEHHSQLEAEQEAQKSGDDSAPKESDDDDQLKLSTVLLKGFFLLVALSLGTSTVLGVWMGVTQLRRPRLAWLLVAVGALVPFGLLLFR